METERPKSPRVPTQAVLLVKSSALNLLGDYSDNESSSDNEFTQQKTSECLPTSPSNQKNLVNSGEAINHQKLNSSESEVQKPQPESGDCVDADFLIDSNLIADKLEPTGLQNVEEKHGIKTAEKESFNTRRSSVSSSSSSDSDSSELEVHLSDSGESETDFAVTGKSRKNNANQVSYLADQKLPPIENLQITVPENEAKPLGRVSSIVSFLIVVEAYKDCPPVNLDTLLFLERGQVTLGRVFDLLGRVHEPHYVVRFNNAEEIAEKNVQVGSEVFYAPKTDYTSYVLLSQLMRAKGSDASWVDDDEPPPQNIEYSDDETEREARRQLQLSKRSVDGDDVVGADAIQKETPQRKVRKMTRGRQRFIDRQQLNKQIGNNLHNQTPQKFMRGQNGHSSNRPHNPQGGTFTHSYQNASSNFSPNFLPNPFHLKREPTSNLEFTCNFPPPGFVPYNQMRPSPYFNYATPPSTHYNQNFSQDPSSYYPPSSPFNGFNQAPSQLSRPSTSTSGSSNNFPLFQTPPPPPPPGSS